MDFRQIIADLRRAGMTQAEIAKRVGASQQYICDLEAGNRGKRIEFAFSLGQGLHDLHKERCGKPTRRRPRTPAAAEAA